MRIVKRIITLILICSMVSASFSNVGLKASESRKQSYCGDGYEIVFELTGEWESGATGKMAIKNTGMKTIDNWMLAFDMEHKIGSVWNGVIETQESNHFRIKNAGWNQDILPGQVIQVGLNLEYKGNFQFPETITIHGKEKPVGEYQTSIVYKVTSDWGTGFNGEIEISNLSDTTIEDWSLAFDFDSEITGFWDAKISSHEGNHYLVKNAGYNGNIEPAQTLKLGFSGKNNSGKKPLNLQLIQVKDGKEELDYLRDTDKDDIPDAFEQQLGTDKDNEDTDGDGLSDGYEHLILRTDPVKQDTDGNGIYDGDEDFDLDGLSNLEEYQLETNPYLEDTDIDDLTDGEEMHKYHTNPLEEDTDEDGISDGDEIKLGLNPLSPNTHEGIADSEYTTKQKVNEGILEDINKDNPFQLEIEVTAAGMADSVLTAEESNYKEMLSDNDAILGKTITISYDELKMEKAVIKFKIEEDAIHNANLNFPSEPGFEGVKRFQIFRYEEEHGVLYPIETEFDPEANTIMVETTALGTFCVVDMDQWLYGLGIDFGEEEEYEVKTAARKLEIIEEFPVKTASGTSIEAAGREDGEAADDVLPDNYEETVIHKINDLYGIQPVPFFLGREYHKQIDLVFAIDTSGSMDNKISKCKSYMKNLVENLYNVGITARVAVISFDDYKNDNKIYKLPDKSEWAKNPKDAAALISQVEITDGYDENHVDALETVLGRSFRKNTTKFAVILTDEELTSRDNNSKIGADGIAEKLKKQGIITSVICSNYDIASFKPIFEKTGGIQISVSSNFNVLLQIFIETVMRNNNKFRIVIPNTMSTITLDSTPKKADKETDTDGDSLKDSEEINWNLVEDNTTTLMLPTLKEYLSSLNYLDRSDFKHLSNEKAEVINSVVVLPIKSNPAAKDSDSDGYDDPDDKKPLKNNIYIYKLKRSSYVTVSKAMKDGIDSYGGDQGWFDEGNPLFTDNILANYGCGTIAAGDWFLYLALQNPELQTIFTEQCLKDDKIEKKDYMNYIRQINIIYTETPRWTGVLGTQLAKALNDYKILTKGIKYKASWKWNLSSDKMKDNIKEMLKNDLPVIISIGPNTPNITGASGINFYTQQRKGDEGYDVNKKELYQYILKYTNSVNGHYVTVTEIVFDENTTKENGEIMLGISSWGKKYYINYKEYRDYVENVGGKWTSSMVYVELKKRK